MALISTKRKTEVRCNHSWTALEDCGAKVEDGESRSAVLVSTCPGDWVGVVAELSTGDLESGVTGLSPAELGWGAAAVAAKTRVPRLVRPDARHDNDERDDNVERDGRGKMFERRNPSGYSTTSGA
jgi:hypothetical protein